MNKISVATIGALNVGGKYPVRIKGMLKSSTDNRKALIREAEQLEREGAEAIRLAVYREKDAGLAQILKKHVRVPLVADIHFHPKLALAALESGFDGIRLNPLNITEPRHVREIARSAKDRRVSIRVGVNSGGFKKKFSRPAAQASAMVKAAGAYLKILERERFFDIMVSLKGSDVVSTIAANRLFRRNYGYPLHLGVTATGTLIEGVTKSAIGLGTLLGEGIGEVIRVSLTASSCEEVRVARYILSALGLRQFGPEVISCPTCSRCQVDLLSMVSEFKKRLATLECKKPLRIALMGCVVNGPGEAAQADIGVAFGGRKAVIFKGDSIIKHTSDERVIDDLIGEVRCLWTEKKSTR